MLQDLHVHSTWSDGKAAPRQMVERALELGLDRVGFSDHSHVAFDDGYCMPADTSAYRREIRALADEYRGRIDVLCGIEQDLFSPPAGDGYDYIIGSAHYVSDGERILAIDDTVEDFERAAAEFCGGDYLALAELYFETVSRVVEGTGADIIGHFDLIKKYNADGRYFDEESPRYRAAWQRAADVLLETGAAFEVNYGAVYAGRQTEPYPGREIREYLVGKGARLIESSDAHESAALACFLDLRAE